MNGFKSMNLPESLFMALDIMKFHTPTPIQEQTIPLIMDGKDILGTAQTGTGKTAAFVIPIITKILEGKTEEKETALILSPTRELASQIYEVVNNMLVNNTEIKTALLIGGEHIDRQRKQLKLRPRIVVGTPGRVTDHLKRRTLKLHLTQYLVLDETDRMLDMGFGPQIERIVVYLRKQVQTLMFSATLPKPIMKLSQKYLKNPARVAVGDYKKAILKIKQEVIHSSEHDKYDNLLTELNQRDGSVLIFVKTKHGAESLAYRLCKYKYTANAIHGDLRQHKRQSVINAFRNKKYRIMVATDIASRGLDIPHIKHVINFDLPQNVEDYIHRIGRTARAGAEGSSLCFVTPKDNYMFRQISRVMPKLQQ